MVVFYFSRYLLLGGTKMKTPKILNDFAFKHVFSQDTKESKEGLKGVLRTFLEQEINDVTIKSSELTDPDKNTKKPRLDLVVELEDGTLVDVEMQMDYVSETLAPRMDYYRCKLFTSQHISGLDYDELKPCFVITFLNAMIHPEQEEFYNRYSLQNQYHRPFYPEGNEKGEMIIIEMKKLDQNKTIEQMDMKERMIYFFLNWQKDKENSKIKEIVEKDPVIKMIDKQASTITDDQWERINREFDELRQNEVEVAKRKTVQKLIQKAVEEAVEETEEKVRAEERLKQEKAKEEASLQKSIEIAKVLKLNGASNELISKSTGLSLEQIKNL